MFNLTETAPTYKTQEFVIGTTECDKRHAAM